MFKREKFLVWELLYVGLEDEDVINDNLILLENIEMESEEVIGSLFEGKL